MVNNLKLGGHHLVAPWQPRLRRWPRRDSAAATPSVKAFRWVSWGYEEDVFENENMVEYYLHNKNIYIYIFRNVFK